MSPHPGNTGHKLGMVCWIVACLLVCPSQVEADVLDVKGGVGVLYGTEFSRSRQDGVGVQAFFELGLSESFSLTLGGGYAGHFIGSGEGYSLVNVGAGLMYNLDILAIVPFLSLKFGYLGQYFDPEVGVTDGVGVSIGVGADYLLTDFFTLGFVFEYHGLLSDLNAFPSYLALTTRVGFRIPD